MNGKTDSNKMIFGKHLMRSSESPWHWLRTYEIPQWIGNAVFHGKFFQMLRVTTANFRHIVINLLQPLNPAKYVVFTATDRKSVCQINWQYFRQIQLNIPLKTEWQLRIISRRGETDQNMAYLCSYHRPVLNSAII